MFALGATPMVAAAAAGQASAGGEVDILAPVPEEPFLNGSLEAGRAYLRSGTVWLARSVNDWFGDRPFEDGGRVTHGRFSVRTRWEQDDGFDASVRLRARFVLPNLEDLAYLYFGQDNERELVTDQPEALSRQQQLLAEQRSEDQTFFAGLGVLLRENLDLRVGVRSAYKPYAQVRFRKRKDLAAAHAIEFRETIFWTSSESFGSTTSFEYAHAWSPTVLLRWLSAATISRDTDDFAWSTSVGGFKRKGDDRVVSLEALVNGETGARYDVSEYGLRMKWSEPVYRDWLIGELIVGHFWAKEDERADREPVWRVGAELEMRF